MPGGPTALGFGYFALAKYAGYSAFCKWGIKPRLKQPSETEWLEPPSALWTGLVRTLIGIGVGAAVGLGFWKIPYFSNHDNFATGLFFALLIPVRVGEWWVLLRLFYNRYALASPGRAGVITLGILTSFGLDALGMLSALILPGGAWVC